MKSSQGITTDVNICFINYEMIKTHMKKKKKKKMAWFESKSLLLHECISAALFIPF